MTVMTVAEDDYQPLYIRESRGWTDQEASDFKKEVERLKDLWYPSIESAPEITTRQALANLGEVYDSTNGFSRIKMESEARRQDSEQRKKRRLHKIELENRNLRWPKPEDYFDTRPASDYWKRGCLYCGFKPRTTCDYEVHIVTRHPGKPAYPGPSDVKLYGL